jgi:hypothetical protein
MINDLLEANSSFGQQKLLLKKCLVFNGYQSSINAYEKKFQRIPFRARKKSRAAQPNPISYQY